MRPVEAMREAVARSRELGPDGVYTDHEQVMAELHTLGFAIVISGFIRRRLSTFSFDLLVRSFRILFRDLVRLGLCCFPGRSLDGLTLTAGWRCG